MIDRAAPPASHLKKRILVQDRGGSGFQTAGICLYVEDLKPGSNKDIGPKEFFEMACSLAGKGGGQRPSDLRASRGLGASLKPRNTSPLFAVKTAIEFFNGQKPDILFYHTVWSVLKSWGRDDVAPD